MIHFSKQQKLESENYLKAAPEWQLIESKTDQSDTQRNQWNNCQKTPKQLQT